MTPARDKEIVLGNKQLLTLFVGGIVMLAVAFVAGYMIGQKSGKPVETAQAGTETTAPPSGRSPLPKGDADPVREPAQVQTQDPGPGSAPPAAVEQQPVTAPVAVPDKRVEAPAPKIPMPEPPVYKEEPRKDESKPAPKAAKADSKSVPLMVPERGMKYVQVTALPRPESDNMVRTLREQKFPAILAESSKENLYRVLVGPFKEESKVAEAKIKLKALGFAEPFVYKPK